MELLSPLPFAFRQWSPEQRRSCFVTLMRLVLLGNTFHDDVVSDNFGLRTTTGQVVVFDLEYLSPTPDDIIATKDKLRRCFNDVYRGTSDAPEFEAVYESVLCSLQPSQKVTF